MKRNKMSPLIGVNVLDEETAGDSKKASGKSRSFWYLLLGVLILTVLILLNYQHLNEELGKLEEKDTEAILTYKKLLKFDQAYDEELKRLNFSSVALIGSSSCDHVFECGNSDQLSGYSNMLNFVSTSNMYCLKNQNLILSYLNSNDHRRLNILRLQISESTLEHMAFLLDRFLLLGLVPATSKIYVNTIQLLEAGQYYQVKSAENGQIQIKNECRPKKSLNINTYYQDISEHTCTAVQHRYVNHKIMSCKSLPIIQEAMARWSLIDSKKKAKVHTTAIFADRLRFISNVAKKSKCGRKNWNHTDAIASSKKQRRHPNYDCEIALQLSDSVLLDAMMEHKRRSFQTNCRFRMLSSGDEKNESHEIVMQNFDKAGLLNSYKPQVIADPSKKTSQQSKATEASLLLDKLFRIRFVSLVRGRTIRQIYSLASFSTVDDNSMLRQMHLANDYCKASPSTAIQSMKAVETLVKQAKKIKEFLHPKLGKSIRVW